MRHNKAWIPLVGLLALACDGSNSPTAENGRTTETPSELESQGASASTNTAFDTIYGVDAQNFLIAFDGNRPNILLRRVKITGTGGQNVVGIDFRASAVSPASPSSIGQLYGITGTTIYVINPRTGVASNGQTLTVPLSGSRFGAGFNPVVDRWRVHGNTEQNLRLAVDNGMTTMDTALAYVSGDPNFGREPNVVGTGYTNSDNDPGTGTELYAIDANLDVLVELNTPNGGQLSTVGSLGIRTNDNVGFDIPAGPARIGYASLTPPRGSSSFRGSTLYRVNLDTGVATRVGAIDNQPPLMSIAVAP